MRKNFVFAALVLCVLLAFPACSFLDLPLGEEPPPPSGEPPSAGTETEPAGKGEAGPAGKTGHPRTEKEITLAEVQRIRTHIEAGEFISALDLLQPQGRPENSPQGMAGLYRRAENGAIKRGQARLAENKPGRAGLLFRAALNSFPAESPLASEIILTRNELEGRIEICAEKLMEQGLTVYREGRLHHAIELWEKILAFAPHHQASRNAIRTAHTQLENLKNMN
ncbi:MAG TPA: hypothetical protein VKO20_02945 [Desulfosalsimonadaceae bacterium]|nr:hypothetical protein [Desulfosalsimonadaceae bacterium]